MLSQAWVSGIVEISNSQAATCRKVRPSDVLVRGIPLFWTDHANARTHESENRHGCHEVCVEHIRWL